ncbi:hypothetical protein [Geoalkalibacter halelectricus]|uniref:hypothetical protein n=1 Tax=Geoalkalibacter halelectricus TaxID=2847045 RepID=UPI00266EFCC8|nr:hypothetical protein [Geoalkalibacter halelectricus]MDO3378763.1 hypothetical protein [Geoalkalibacter halelectricus]
MTRLLIVLLTLGLTASAVFGASIEGRLVLDGEPLEGMRVEAHATLDFSQEPLAVSEPSDEFGLYRLDLPAGLYALFARDAERGLFAFCGRNPVALADETVWAGLQGVKTTPPRTAPYDDGFNGAVEGVVLFEGAPVAEARVYLYLDAEEDLKGQGYRMSPPTGSDGRFAFDTLPETGYYLVARKRAGGGQVGPVREGDLFGVYAGNPLYLPAGQSLDINLPMVRKVQDENRSETFVRATGMAFSGRVVDPEGRPVAGMHVFAYTDRVIGHQRPAALSAPTGVDGRYVVYLREPGVYYVGSRQKYGDSPRPGELFGMYDQTADHSLMVLPGETLEGIDIEVAPVDLGFAL